MNPLFLLSSIGMMAVAIVAIVYWKVHSKVLWRLFLLGALAWIVGITAKIIAAIPTQTIMDFVRGILPRYLSEPALWIYIGLLTGVFECGATLAFAHIKRIRSAKWKEAVGFGLGFGAVEALLVGVGSFILVLLVILIPEMLPEELVNYLTSGTNSLLIIPAPIIERITVIFLHALSCVLIVYSVQVKEWKWFWFSFFYKTAIDAIAGYMHLANVLKDITTLGTWVVELVFLPFGIVGLWGLWKFRRRWEGLQVQSEPAEDDFM